MGGLTIQGARTTDAASGQWTTPDAYAGDIHDPMSRKAFMWDRNNPYEYSDPSGYSPDAAQQALADAVNAAIAAAASVRDLNKDPEGFLDVVKKELSASNISFTGSERERQHPNSEGWYKRSGLLK